MMKRVCPTDHQHINIKHRTVLELPISIKYRGATWTLKYESVNTGNPNNLIGCVVGKPPSDTSIHYIEYTISVIRSKSRSRVEWVYSESSAIWLSIYGEGDIPGIIKYCYKAFTDAFVEAQYIGGSVVKL